MVCICVLIIISVLFVFSMLKNEKVGRVAGEVIVSVDKTEYRSGETAEILLKNNTFSQITAPSLNDQILIERFQNNAWEKVDYFPCPCATCGIAMPETLRFNESRAYQWELYEVNCGQPPRIAQSGIYRVGIDVSSGKMNAIVYSNKFIIENTNEIILATPQDEYAPGCQEITGVLGGCFGKSTSFPRKK